MQRFVSPLFFAALAALVTFALTGCPAPKRVAKPSDKESSSSSNDTSSNSTNSNSTDGETEDIAEAVEEVEEEATTDTPTVVEPATEPAGEETAPQASNKVTLGDPALTSGIPGVGALTNEQ